MIIEANIALRQGKVNNQFDEYQNKTNFGLTDCGSDEY
jgi:hypothetical protein